MASKRKELKLTQEQAAELIGITRASIGAYEEGRAKPHTDLLIKIARAYGVTDVVSFVSGKEKAQEEQSSAERISMAYLRLAPATKKAVNILMGIE